MSTKKLKLTVTYTAEIEVDARVVTEDLKWAGHSTFETSDGRRNFSVELAVEGAASIAKSFAYYVHGATASRLARKYPGLRGREYLLKLPDPKLGYRLEEKAYVKLDGSMLYLDQY